ncbi:leucine-rich repeat domain-containing protein [Sphingomicrobium aestuariivivum]|uniref:leucine-rich repeat domain-containing protein n=1 Tax=Sphingomicrobium aestuariivivum TaxID=1582356 RepID=UPI001FD6B26A|nr:hypothetical protein [Sphingomicrobium aestuariivivum]MCJ8190781.1 hypothetical protein [Sphingomicrobium aestuariivivum]
MPPRPAPAPRQSPPPPPPPPRPPAPEIDPRASEDAEVALAEAERIIATCDPAHHYRIWLAALDRLPRNMADFRGRVLNIRDTAIGDLSDLPDLPEVVTLQLGEREVDLSVLDRLPGLGRLEAWTSTIRNLEPVTDCPRLADVAINVARVADLSPLAHLSMLENIALWDYAGQPLWEAGVPRHFSTPRKPTGTLDPRVFASWPNLKVLSAYEGPGLSAPLPALPQLELLQVTESRPEDFAALPHFAALETASFTNCGIADAGLLAGLPKLERVRFTDTAIGDLSPLRECPVLRDVAATRCTVSGIAGLLDHPRLKRLDLEQCGIEDISDWGPSEAVESLELAGNPIRDISSLRGWPNLRALNLKQTKVTDPAQAAPLPMLQYLTLSGTPIDRLDFILAFPALGSLGVSGTAIADLSPLARHPNLLRDGAYSWREGVMHHVGFEETPAQAVYPELVAAIDGKDGWPRQRAMREYFGLPEKWP